MVFLCGAKGLLGHALSLHFQESGEPHLTSSRESSAEYFIDLAVPAKQWRLPKTPLQVAVLCAASTGLRTCQDDPSSTRRINVEGTVALAEQLLQRNCAVLFLSSSMVFDGFRSFPGEEDKTCPVHEYGRQKRDTEKALMQLQGSITVLRMTKVIHPGLELFKSWHTSLARGLPVLPYPNVHLSPLTLHNAVSGLVWLAKNPIRGIFHLSADVDISYYQCALKLAAQMNADPSLVIPSPGPEPGPRFGSLAMKSTTLKTGLVPVDGIKALDSVLGAICS